jgi:Rad52/22 family double-strand break repair protein
MATKAVLEATHGFSQAQIEQLLRPINPVRVLTDGKGFSHVSQQDILAHLTRIFGFGNFDIDIKNVELVFEMPSAKPERFNVCYKALVRLTVRNERGDEVCHFENGSMETSQGQTRGDGHDLAYKSAISLSIKRAAIALGDQFGLSLYNKGQMSALVRSTLVGLPVTEAVDVQEGVAKQVSLGNDETEAPTEAPTTPQIAPVVAIQPPKPIMGTETATAVVKAPTGLLLATYEAIKEATDLDPLRAIWIRNANYLDESFECDGITTTLRTFINIRKGELEGKK